MGFEMSRIFSWFVVLSIINWNQESFRVMMSSHLLEPSIMLKLIL
jgi:hypothetical protein